MTPRAAQVNGLAKEYRRMIDHRQSFERKVRITFPIGAEIFYRHGDHLRFATVTGHLYGERLRVQGRTGKIYDIEANRIINEMSDRGI